jgi:hypothetical protein
MSDAGKKISLPHLSSLSSQDLSDGTVVSALDEEWRELSDSYNALSLGLDEGEDTVMGRPVLESMTTAPDPVPDEGSDRTQISPLRIPSAPDAPFPSAPSAPLPLPPAPSAQALQPPERAQRPVLPLPPPVLPPAQAQAISRPPSGPQLTPVPAPAQAQAISRPPSGPQLAPPPAPVLHGPGTPSSGLRPAPVLAPIVPTPKASSRGLGWLLIAAAAGGLAAAVAILWPTPPPRVSSSPASPPETKPAATKPPEMQARAAEAKPPEMQARPAEARPPEMQAQPAAAAAAKKERFPVPDLPPAELAARRKQLERCQMKGSLEEILAQVGEIPETYLDLGGCAVKQGRAQEGVGHYQKALSMRPDEPWAFLGMARAYERLGDNQQALTWYRKYQPVAAKSLLPTVEQRIAKLSGAAP